MVEPIAKVATQDDAVTFLYSETLAAADRYADAARVLESVSARQPSASLALALFRLRQKGGLASPFEPLERWLASNPGDLAVRAHYAEALREAGDNRHAAEQYAVIVAAAPDKVAALNNLAWLYYLEGDARALPLARRAWEQAPKDPSVLDTYGWLQVESGAVEEGLVHLQAADAAAGVAQPEVHLHYLAALSRAGDAGRARELLTSFMAEGPAFENQPEASRLLASIRESAST
jgi:Tfp pilus assembly protein PilF